VVAIHNFRQAEFRERVTGAVLEMLADLPEAQRMMTSISNRHRGYQPKQIADILGGSLSEREARDADAGVACRGRASSLAKDRIDRIERSQPS
jgi:DNA-directed RNA polymerase specialized sigma24 family protein